jgi:regulator of RNase E activity RraA
VPFAPTSPFSASSESSPKIIAPASTLKLVSKNAKETYPEMKQFAVPDGKHWVDMTEEGTIVVIDQPEGQSCAAIGGIMANRMKINGVAGCVVGGRIRDLAELKASGLPVSIDISLSTITTRVNYSILTRTQVFALGRSTVGTGAEAKVLARNCPIKVQNVDIHPVSPLTSLFPHNSLSLLSTHPSIFISHPHQ